MRRRGTGSGIRAELAAEYRYMADLYDWAGAARVAAQIEAGETVTVHGYEVGMPAHNRVRVAPDGSIQPMPDGQPLNPCTTTRLAMVARPASKEHGQ